MPNYLYNGIELPELPEWDKDKYPYVYMSKHTMFGLHYIVKFFSAPYQIVGVKEGSRVFTGFETGDTLLRSTFIVTDMFSDPSEDWSVLIEKIIDKDSKEEYYTPSLYTPVWSNYDIRDLDGNLLLAASDPVPVGGDPEEPEEPEPTTAPADLYKIKNGAWQKQDVYKQVGNSWVKQPQGAVEVEGGAWSALS